MELDERKLNILRMVIDDYIMTAAPVGSRAISKRGDVKLSSATIRNEMSDLEEMGYLDSPHTSAGRVPSEKAYRLYVDTLMGKARLTASENVVMMDFLSKRKKEVNEVINETAKLLSEFTKYTAIVMSPQIETALIKRISLVPITDGKALAVLVTDNGLVHDTIVYLPPQIAENELERYSQMLTRMLKYKTTAQAMELLNSSMQSLLSPQYKFIEDILRSLDKRLAEEDSNYVALEGATNLLMHPEYSDINKARAMLTALETKDNLKKLLQRQQKLEFTVTIGGENDLVELKDSSVITAEYKIGGKAVGSYGVIGPVRMNYSHVLCVMQEMGYTMSRILSKMLIDDEEKEKHT